MSNLSKEKQIAEAAYKAFKSHSIDQRMFVFESFDKFYGHWVCSDGGSSIHRFDIQHKPGTLTVSGDIGDLIVERCPNMIAWCRGALRDISYFAEKVPSAIPTREPSIDKRREYLETMLTVDPTYCSDATYNKWGQLIEDSELSVWQELHDELSWNVDGAHDVFMATLYDSPLCSDGEWLPDLTDWTNNFLCCREAVSWFVSHWDGPKDPKGE